MLYMNPRVKVWHISVSHIHLHPLSLEMPPGPPPSLPDHVCWEKNWSAQLFLFVMAVPILSLITWHITWHYIVVIHGAEIWAAYPHEEGQLCISCQKMGYCCVFVVISSRMTKYQTASVRSPRILLPFSLGPISTCWNLILPKGLQT